MTQFICELAKNNITKQNIVISIKDKKKLIVQKELLSFSIIV